MGDTSEWLTVDEIAGRMRISKMTVYRMVHVGQVPATRFGRTLRIRAADFEDYLESCRVVPAGKES